MNIKIETEVLNEWKKCEEKNDYRAKLYNKVKDLQEKASKLGLIEYSSNLLSDEFNVRIDESIANISLNYSLSSRIKIIEIKKSLFNLLLEEIKEVNMFLDDYNCLQKKTISEYTDATEPSVK